MRHSWARPLAGVLSVLLVLLLVPVSQAENSAGFGYTKTKAALYAGPSASQKTKETIKAFTVVPIAKQGGKYLELADGTYVLAQDVGIFRVFSAQGKVVYWEKDQVMYATGNSNHPLKPRLPANTPIYPLHTMVDYYLVFWEGVYGFVPMQGAKEPPRAQSCAPVFARLTEDVPFYELPLAAAPSAFRLPRERAAVLGEKAGSFYLFPWNNRVYYVRDTDITPIGTAVVPRNNRAYAEDAVTLWDFPDDALGQRVGAVPGGTECTLSYAINGYVQLTHAGVTGFARAGDFLYPGAGDGNAYALLLNKSTRELAVYLADQQGNRVGQPVLTAIVAIGKFTTPTPSGQFTLGNRERWHYFGPSYTPYTIYYTTGRYLHGPLYWSRSESALNAAHLADFGQAVTGGCIRTPYDAMQWIYYHCSQGTPLEIVNGVQAAAGEDSVG